MTRHLGAAAFLAIAAGAAHAGEVSCTGSNVGMNLGVYTVSDVAPLDSSRTFTISCTRSGGPRTEQITVGIGPSAHTGGVASRALKLAIGADLLSYNLFRDAARQQVWGDTPGVNTVTQTIALENRTTGTITFTIFGRMPVAQDVRAGAYADQLTITVMP